MIPATIGVCLLILGIAVTMQAHLHYDEDGQVQASWPYVLSGVGLALGGAASLAIALAGAL